ncbi:MAG: DUF4118 domain-containing protein [Microthrixaceae bacterium]
MELGFGTVDLEPGNKGDRPHIGIFIGATLVPFAISAALIPLRGDLAHSAGIILVVPIIAFALYWGTFPGSIAAASAAIGFDFFLLPPYYTPRIDKPEDIIAGITLLGVGLVVGQVGSRLARMDRRSTERLRELSILETHAQMIADRTNEAEPVDTAQIIDATAENLINLLDLESCEWEPMTDWDPSSTVGQPTLLDNGQIIGRMADLPEDRSQLPNPVELVVAGEERPYGRFILVPNRARTSIEERRIAATLCRLTSTYLSAQEN